MPKGISVPVVQSGLEASIQQGVRSVGQINIPVNVDPSAFKNLAQPLGRVSGLATEFEKSIAASNARVLAFGASVGIINGVQNAFSDLVKTGIEVQKTLADIAAISGQGGKQLSQFGDALFDIGKTTGQSFKTAAQAALEFSRQGLSVEETLKRTTDALTLTRFTSLNAAEAVDVLTAAANSFGETGITTAQIINKLVAVDTKFAVSAEDLANGLARAGSIAQEVGVNFDELNAAITVAQERTARGGAVIGNALKTIFTRLRSDETVQALRDIGVESLNAQGQLKGAVPLLQEVAQKIQGLSGGERIQILEAVASKYNINILSSLLDDLNNANSKFTQAVAVSAGASNQAYERQIELNKTLAAQINVATVSVGQLFNKLSEIGVTESLSNLLKFVNSLLEGFNKLLDSEGVGGNIAKGLIKGISDVFFTVGLPIIGAIFIKLTKDIAQFGVESLKTILGINQQVKERQALEQAVVNTLIRDQEIMASILALSGNRTKQEEYLLAVYNRQLTALQQVQDIASSVTPALMAGGLSATTGRVQKRGASGYLPAQEAADVRRGVGGASASSRVVSIPNFAFGGGKRGTMIANTSEYIVPNFANGGSAIFNKDMVRSYGLPAGARKISAAGGYIPNFADKYTIKQGVQSLIGNLRFPEEWTSSGGSNRPRDQARAALAEINMSRKASGQSELTFSDLYTSQALQSKKDIIQNANQYAEARGVAMLLPSISAGDAANTKGQAGVVPSLKNQKIAPFVKFKAFGLTTASATKQKDVPDIEAKISEAITNEAFNIVNEFDPVTGKQPFDKQGFKKYFLAKGGAAGAVGAAAGATFEAAVDYAFNPADAESGSKGGTTFDVNKISPTLRQVFGNIPENIIRGDYKISDAQVQKFADQILLNGAYDLKSTAASGFIPNFAAGSPLGDAINREMAAGVSPNKIRITQDGRLRNAGNPGGLAVINTRDEPNGRVPNFAKIGASKTGYESFDPSIVASGGSPILPKDVQKAMIDKINVYIKAFESGTINQNQLNEAVKTLANQNQLTQKAEEKLQKQVDSAASRAAKTGLENSTEKAKVGLDKMFYAMSGVTIAGNILEASFKNAGEGTKKWVNAISNAAQSATSFALLGSTAGSALESFSKNNAGKGGALGKIAGFAGQAAGALPIAGAIGGAVQSALISYAESQLAEIENAPAKQAGQEAAGKFTTKTEMIDRLKVLGAQVARGGTDDKTNAEYDALKKKVRELGEAEKSQAKQKEEADRNANAELAKRLPLETKLNEINLSFAKSRSILDENAAKRQAELLSISANLTEDQKDIAEYALKAFTISDKRTQVEQESLQSLVNEVAQKSKLATVDETAIESLIKRVELGQETVDFEKAARDLGIEGAAGLEKLIRGEVNKKNIKLVQLDAEGRILKISTDAAKVNKDQQETLQRQANLVKIRYEYEKKILDTRTETQQIKTVAELESPLLNLQKKFSQQTFTTGKQEAQLANLNAETKYNLDLNKISYDALSKRKDALEDTRKSIIGQIQALKNLTPEQKTEFEAQLNLAKSYEDLIRVSNQYTQNETNERKAAFWESATLSLEAYAEALNRVATIEEIERSKLQDPKKTAEFRKNLLRQSSPFAYGIKSVITDIEKESSDFSETFAKNTTIAFRDGLRDAMSAAISQTDDLGSALQNVAMNFLKSMQSAFLNQAAGNVTVAIGKSLGMAKGGLVTGGSGYRDDVPRMLTGGEFVMRKSAVQKYGTANLAKMNNGGIFLPGVRGGGSISGYDALTAFANQTTTSGATDILRGSGSSAFINLEDQSARLSRFGLLNEDIINQEIRSAQEQGLNLISQREAYRTNERKALQKQLFGTIASAALMAGVSRLTGSFGADSDPGEVKKFWNYVNKGGKAYGGMIRRYASGGPTDDIPALLMSGEYIMNRGATSKYGKRLLDSMNQGRAPRFTDGGEVGATTTSSTTETTPKMTGDVNISINVSGQGSQTEAQGNTNQGGIDYKKMSERIKAVVLETINEEKRLGGALRSR